MADTAPMTTYVPKAYTKEEKRKWQRVHLMHKKKKARKAAAAKA